MNARNREAGFRTDPEGSSAGWRAATPAIAVALAATVATAAAPDIRQAGYGARLPGDDAAAVVWWASSGWKVGADKPAPTNLSAAATVAAARNEAEAVQLVVTPARPLTNFTAAGAALAGPAGAVLPASAIELLRVQYVNVTEPTDAASPPGLWPDPLPPLRAPLTLAAGVNQPLWVRVRVPRGAPPGVYTGAVQLAAANWSARAPLRVEVYGFTLPDRLTCTTAFGFSPWTVFRYHKPADDTQRRALLDRYWATFAAHHISPYDPAPLDPLRVTWPDVQQPPAPLDNWSDARVVTNEVRDGRGALALFDDNPKLCVGAAYKPLLAIPPGGFRLRFDYRTALPDHTFLVSLGHHDGNGRWMSGCNRDIALRGNGRWQAFDEALTTFPADARSVGLRLYATDWTESGEHTGLVWFDNVALLPAGGTSNLLTGGDFEPRDWTRGGPATNGLRVAFDFAAWDSALQRAVDTFHFNSFRLDVPGMGGGTYEGHTVPVLRGFPEASPVYQALFGSYLGQVEAHLRKRGWLDEAYVYWFDEPGREQYPFVRAGFERLKRVAPQIGRMLTEQPEPGLYGGPDIWCPITPEYDHVRAEERRRQGERFWWYVCCGPKAPQTGLFLDHAGTELRVWLWQTWARGITGVLVWETVYWTSHTAYPAGPQNPYADPMSWTSGAGLAAGQRRKWGNGDGRFLYPPEAAAAGTQAGPVLDGPVDSIRWEMLRDGLEDYEYLALLRARLAQAGATLTAERRAELEALLNVPPAITTDLQTFTKDPAPIEAHRARLARALAAWPE